MTRSGRNGTTNPRVSRLTRYARWAFQAALLVGIFWLIHAYQTGGVVRGTAPVFAATLLDGRQVRLQDYRGKPLLVHFWATWCPVCRMEVGSLAAIARDHAVLSVALEDTSAAGIQGWLEQRGAEFPVVLDPEGAIAGRYGVKGVPTSIVIDGGGGIRFVEVGYTTEIGLRVRLWWAGRSTS